MSRDKSHDAVAAVVEHLTAMTAVVCDPDGQGGDPAVAVVKAVTAAFPGIDGAALTRTRAQRPYTAAASDETADQWNHQQLQAKQGPSLDALTRAAPMLVSDLLATNRWPRLRTIIGSRASKSPAMRSAYCFPLPHAGQAATVLTLYSLQAHALDGADPATVKLVLGYVDLALAGLNHHVRAGNLTRAMTSNQRIGTAIGILMTLHHFSPDEAQRALAVASQALNRKVADLADEIVLTGAMPDMPH